MGILDIIAHRKSIDEYVEEARREGGVLVDVRNMDEFDQGHIPGAICVPVGMVSTLADRIASKDDALYVYCLSGVRSALACKTLKGAGYAAVTNIGGIKSYHGPIER